MSFPVPAKNINSTYHIFLSLMTCLHIFPITCSVTSIISQQWLTSILLKTMMYTE